jgi:hypothetical protein
MSGGDLAQKPANNPSVQQQLRNSFCPLSLLLHPLSFLLRPLRRRRQPITRAIIPTQPLTYLSPRRRLIHLPQRLPQILRLRPRREQLHHPKRCNPFLPHHIIQPQILLPITRSHPQTQKPIRPFMPTRLAAIVIQIQIRLNIAIPKQVWDMGCSRTRGLEDI